MMKFVLLQPPQCDSSPRRAPAVDTGSDEPGTSQAESQSKEREGSFPLQASVDRFVPVSCTGHDQEDMNQLHHNKPLLARSLRDQDEAVAAKDDSMDYRAKQAV